MFGHHKKEKPFTGFGGFGGGGLGLGGGGEIDLGPLQASGGSESTPGDGYKYHDYTPTGPQTFTINDGQATVEILMQGAGGGGGGGRGNGGNNNGGAGGTGGGTLNISTFLQGPMTCPINVGARGTGGPKQNSGNSGGNSTFTSPYGQAYGKGGSGGSGGISGATPASPAVPNTVGPSDHTAVDNYRADPGNGTSSGSGGSGTQAAGDPQAAKWWYPWIQPGEGGNGAPHGSGTGGNASNYGGGGGGGTGSWDDGQGAQGGNGAQGRVVVRYLITNP